MPFNSYPSALQEYHPMKTPSNSTEPSEPWNMIAKIAHDETANALRMLSHFGSGYMRVIRCRMPHVNVQTGRLPFTAGWLAVCLLARVPALFVLLSDSFTFGPFNLPRYCSIIQREAYFNCTSIHHLWKDHCSFQDLCKTRTRCLSSTRNRRPPTPTQLQLWAATMLQFQRNLDSRV
jgi:hypothetical protein